MIKAEFMDAIKNKFDSLGYHSRRGYFYKTVGEDYLIGFDVCGSTFCKGYSFTCGAVYLPDDLKTPFRGKFDIQMDFVFPMRSINDPRSIYECIEDLDKKYAYKNNIFEFELFSVDELDLFFDVNYKYIAEPFYDPNYGLDILKSDWKKMNRHSAKTVIKICERAGLNSEEVLSYLKKPIR